MLKPLKESALGGIKLFDKGAKVNCLFALNLAINATNSFLMPVREGLTLDGGKELQTKLMMLTVVVSIVGQALFAYHSKRHGGLDTLKSCLIISSIACVATYGSLQTFPLSNIFVSSIFYLWFTFYNMTAMSAFWAVAGDVLEGEKGTNQTNKKIAIFGHLAAGGTLGHIAGSSTASFLIRRIGTRLCLNVLSVAFLLATTLCTLIEQLSPKSTAGQHREHDSTNDPSPENKAPVNSDIDGDIDNTKSENKSASMGLLSELRDQYGNIGLIFADPILFYSFLYQVLLSTSLGLTVIERTMAAKSSAIGSDGYARILAENQLVQGAVQFSIQFLGSGMIAKYAGPTVALSFAPLFRFASFVGFFLVQSKLFPSLTAWYHSSPATPVTFVIISDLLCRIATQSVSKPVRESLWTHVPKTTKYRAKILVDVLAHRVGTSVAAFLANIAFAAALKSVLPPSLGDLFVVQDHIFIGLFATAAFCGCSFSLGHACYSAKANAAHESTTPSRGNPDASATEPVGDVELVLTSKATGNDDELNRSPNSIRNLKTD